MPKHNNLVLLNYNNDDLFYLKSNDGTEALLVAASSNTEKAPSMKNLKDISMPELVKNRNDKLKSLILFSSIENKELRSKPNFSHLPATFFENFKQTLLINDLGNYEYNMGKFQEITEPTLIEGVFGVAASKSEENEDAYELGIADDLLQVELPIPNETPRLFEEETVLSSGLIDQPSSSDTNRESENLFLENLQLKTQLQTQNMQLQNALAENSRLAKENTNLKASIIGLLQKHPQIARDIQQTASQTPYSSLFASVPPSTTPTLTNDAPTIAFSLTINQQTSGQPLPRNDLRNTGESATKRQKL